MDTHHIQGSVSEPEESITDSRNDDLPRQIAVIGAGVMGTGVAQTFAASGFSVTLIDHSSSVLTRAPKTIRQQLRATRLTHPDKIIKPVASILESIHTTGDMEAIRQADYVIENISESIEKKQQLYQQLCPLLKPDTILVANTSAVPLCRLTPYLDHPENLLGIHFMNPVLIKDTVELIISETTSADALRVTRNLLTAINKKAIEVADKPGFVSNRILMLTINEAIRTLEDKVSTAENIDAVFKHCFGHPMGPLATADLIGLDVIRDTLRVLESEFADSKYRPAKRLESMVENGELGRKTGRGFFQY